MSGDLHCPFESVPGFNAAICPVCGATSSDGCLKASPKTYRIEQAAADRAALVAERDRLAAEVERLTAENAKLKTGARFVLRTHQESWPAYRKAYDTLATDRVGPGQPGYVEAVLQWCNEQERDLRALVEPA